MKTYHQIVRDLCQVYPEGEARAMARWLCEECLGLSQTDLLLDKDNHLSADDLVIIKEITSRLLQHEPIQYILGTVDFCGHRFMAAPGALIPRPETAELVSRVLASLAPPASQDTAPLRILDIGTGTGCIALSLALALPGAQVTAWDVSEAALAIARENDRRHPEAQVVFELEDILHPRPTERQWDIIVSNPPYVRQSEARAMEKRVLNYEPHLALFVPDADPLLFYRAIAQFARQHLCDGGQLWLEINEALGAETAHLIEENGLAGAEVLKDIHGRDRMLHAINLKKHR
ncbi:MAG: peptide chain release factor N(5)-glutamine methyltransferase [Bacteroidaceae bacterium]|nr:peptide chain release factor N(5)-glutamine methyltransferase [Bacteroidaceae bacterium]